VIDRRTFLGALTGSLLAAPLAAEAQQAGEVALEDLSYRDGVHGAGALRPLPSRAGAAAA